MESHLKASFDPNDSPPSILKPALYIACAVLGIICAGLVFAIVVAVTADDGSPPPRTKDWELVDTGFCTFRHPPTMELRKGNAMKAVAALINAKAGVEGSPEFVVQPKGMDQFATGSFDTYARMMVSTDVQKPGSFPTQWQTKYFSPDELRDVERELKSALDEEYATMSARLPSSMRTRITEWRDARIVPLGNRIAIVVRFERQMADNPPVLVRSYAVFEDDRTHKVIVSFREEERDLWESDLEAMLATIRFDDS